MGPKAKDSRLGMVEESKVVSSAVIEAGEWLFCRDLLKL